MYPRQPLKDISNLLLRRVRPLHRPVVTPSRHVSIKNLAALSGKRRANEVQALTKASWPSARAVDHVLANAAKLSDWINRKDRKGRKEYKTNYPPLPGFQNLRALCALVIDQIWNLARYSRLSVRQPVVAA